MSQEPRQIWLKFKTDLKAEAGSTNSLNNVAKDVPRSSKTSPLETALQPKPTPTRSIPICRPRSSNPPATWPSARSKNLVVKISDALSAGAVQSAVQDVAGYLVQHGQASGSSINLSV